MSYLSRKRIRDFTYQLIADERGGATIEYALVASLIIIACIALIANFGTRVLARWNSVNAAAI